MGPPNSSVEKNHYCDKKLGNAFLHLAVWNQIYSCPVQQAGGNGVLMTPQTLFSPYGEGS